MLVVSDTSPINYLDLIQQETRLPVLYERMVIPPAVYEELQRSQTPEEVRQWIAHPPVWLRVQRPQQPLSVRQFPRLDDGELEAIPLAQELGASFLLMDDFEGREEAERRALTVTGTLGVLETAAIRGLIDLPSVLAQLQATTFYASQCLYDEVLARDAARKSRPPSRAYRACLTPLNGPTAGRYTARRRGVALLRPPVC
jgi:predicted nucleic acid-binding protein